MHKNSKQLMNVVTENHLKMSIKVAIRQKGQKGDRIRIGAQFCGRRQAAGGAEKNIFLHKRNQMGYTFVYEQVESISTDIE